MHRRGFTLVELMVVMAIMGVLVGMLFPAVQYARASARRTQCQSQLHQMGIAMDQYMDARGTQAKYPDVGILKSVTPDKPTIAEVLGKFAENNKQLWNCPSDTDFFPKEGLSYEFPVSRLSKKTRQQALKSSTGVRSSTTVWILYDFECFHGTEGDPGSRNFLYMDGHVDAT